MRDPLCPGGHDDYTQYRPACICTALAAARREERERAAGVMDARARRFRHGAGAGDDGIVRAREEECRDGAAAIRALSPEDTTPPAGGKED